MHATPRSRHSARALGALVGLTLVIASTALVTVAVSGSDDSVMTGPTSRERPYLKPFGTAVVTRSILTVGDRVGGYRLAGIPDGLGFIDDGSTFRLFVNHELSNSVGVARAHGGIGAFVSEWTIDKKTLAVRSGRDLIQTVKVYDKATGEYQVATGAMFNRLCSATLADAAAFRDPRVGGFNGRILLNGEEAGDNGRAFAHIVEGAETGTTYELPSLGQASWENLVASPASGAKTVVIGLDDTTPGELYVYVGDKSKKGNPIEQAGLSGGALYGVKVAGATTEDRTTGITDGTVFTLPSLGRVDRSTGSEIQSASTALGVTKFLRPEDGSWDPSNPNDFYFVTTDRFDTIQTPTSDGVANTGSGEGNSRLYRLRFQDVRNPALGGTIDMLLDGKTGSAGSLTTGEDPGTIPQMMDNVAVDRTGHVILQEDPGNQAYVAKVWSYDIARDSLSVLAIHEPDGFKAVPGAATFMTKDEESSGVIDASSLLGPGWFLLTVQSHQAANGLSARELVEGGQLLALYSPGSDTRSR